MIVCREIRKVSGGYIVEVRHPWGDDHPYGEVICPSIEDVFQLLRKAANDEAPKETP